MKNTIRFALTVSILVMVGCASHLPDDGTDGGGDITCYRDNDLDGVSTPESTVFHDGVCEDGWVPYRGNDCNDNDVNVQYNCTNPEIFCYFDEDGDGHGVPPGSYRPGTVCPPRYTTTVGDCAPQDPLKWTGCTTCTPTTEICNGKDDDCDGSSDEGGVCSCVPSTPNESGTLCSDTIDNDCDGKIDAADPGCNVCTSTGQLIGQSVTLAFRTDSAFPSDLASVGGQSISRNNARIVGWNCAGTVQTAPVGTSLTIQIPNNCPGGWLILDVFLDGSIDAAGNPDEPLYASFANHEGQDLNQLGGFTASYTNNGVTTAYAGSDIRIVRDMACRRFSTDSRIQSQFRDKRPYRIAIPIDARCTGGQMPPNVFSNIGTCVD